ncbi:hypothetical protein [Burkholderia diffusa]|uniref:hypothetical protein n=1 Tax=Burkholderia diffusa TaxID=488732 RepID=UPI000A8F6378|nr:hypothetical protein [Burkholderia diffusa]
MDFHEHDLICYQGRHGSRGGRFEEHRDAVCRREAANVSARAAISNQQLLLCSAGFVMMLADGGRDGMLQKNARCTQRARIPVKEVSHELRVQNKSIARGGQRSDSDIDIACPVMSLHASTDNAAHEKRRAACVAERRPPACCRSMRAASRGCPADHGS